MSANETAQDRPTPTKCRIAEIEQFKCAPVVDLDGHTRMHCIPVPRIFRICPGRPAVEITTLVNVNLETGDVEITPETMNTMPKTSAWRDFSASNGR
ncbi:hypothetical protein BDV93DRAFT_524763 [Ceratobasidium sp. AG-I]|nr:hypothetical protein BDV93DRAFT_524763 [Ceratobasidium sp. AG-I]